MSEVQSKLVINPENSKPLLIAEALENYLGTAEWALLRRVAVIAEGEGKALFLVGGSVRDFLLGIRGNFPDLAYEGNAIELAELVSNKLGGSLVRYKTFMTATWDLGMIKEDVAKILKVDPAALPEAIDFTSTRSERYPNAGALPKVKGSDIGADLQRRDFSINAIALRLDGTHVGEIIALEGAFVDLEQGLLRILHEKSFEDDATRMLRILRFGGRLGFELADATRKILKQSLHFLADISGERIRNELDLALAEESWSSILDQMEEIELLKAIHPKLQFKDESKRALDFYKAIESDSGWGISMIHEHWLPMTIWLMHLQASNGQTIAKRLNLEADIREALDQISSIKGELEKFTEFSPSELSHKLDSLSPLAIFALYASSMQSEVRKKIERYVMEWQHIQPKSTGETLKKLSVKEGPLYAQVLARLRAAWIDEEVNSADEEKELLTKLLNSESD